MSPELRRNLWLELTSSRVVLMTSILGLVAIAVFLISGRSFAALAPVGVIGFIFITIFWGSRNAARSVIGEIRERTWDFQRLSAVTPVSMTLGKLFGATSYTWYGGLLALLIATPGLLRAADAATVATAMALLVASGLLAHAAALGSALANARRRRADARLSVLPHQAVGLVAAFAPTWLVSSVARGEWTWAPSRDGIFTLEGAGAISWYGESYNALLFTAGAALIFAVWAMIGAWREMRLELMETNRPIFWPLFLVVLSLFLAGFGTRGGQGLALAYLGVHVAALVALVVEPKNAVELRALGDAFARARLSRVLTGLPAYGWAFVAAAVLAIWLAWEAPVRTMGGETVLASTALAALGFLARDIGIFHFFHAKPKQMRGDFSSLVTLALLYVVGGWVANGTHEPIVSALVWPTLDAPEWALVLPWLQAAAVWMLAIARFRGSRTEGVGAPVGA